jgi:sirohydrochlorin cobaltochelatase
MTAAIVLIAHGSRDPAWPLPLEGIARRLRERLPGTEVRLAYLEHSRPQPDEVLAALVQAGCRRASLAPLFLGIGAHGRADIAAIVERARLRHPDLALSVLPVLGEMSPVQDSLAGALATWLESTPAA